MSLITDISTQLVEAMRAKDAARLSALRNLKAALANELLALKRGPTEMLSDEETLAIVKRLVKQRRDSIDQFRKGNREELAKAEEAELKVLLTFLPQMMSEAEVRKSAETVKAKMGTVDKTKLGQFIGTVMKETKGRADGAVVKKVAEALVQ